MRVALALLSLLALAFAGCADSSNDDGASSSQTSTDAAAGAGAHGVPQTIEVMAMNSAFDPQKVTIKAGDTIHWVDHDNANPHNVVSDTPGYEFRSPDMDGVLPTYPNDYSHTFDHAGVVDYVCDKHNGMTGQIIVE